MNFLPCHQLTPLETSSPSSQQQRAPDIPGLPQSPGKPLRLSHTRKLSRYRSCSPGEGLISHLKLQLPRTLRCRRGETSLGMSASSLTPLTGLRPLTTQPVLLPFESLAKRYCLGSHADPLSLLHRAYFPLHEDPRSRVKTPHPFREGATTPHGESASHAPVERNTAPDLEEGESPMTVTPTGSPQFPFPSSIGAFPPPTPSPTTLPASGDLLERRYGWPAAPSLITSHPAGSDRPQTMRQSRSDARHRLLQYQRDMVTQMSMAAQVALTRADTTKTRIETGRADGEISDVGNALIVARARLTAASVVRPDSPQLRPLSSPGPVTPISLAPSPADT